MNGKKLVSVGYIVPGYTDNDLAPLGLSRGLEQLTETFDYLYEESERQPRAAAGG